MKTRKPHSSEDLAKIVSEIMEMLRPKYLTVAEIREVALKISYATDNIVLRPWPEGSDEE